MRVSWNGSLSFGLVSIPVGLAPATKPAARQSDVSFRLLHRECMTPIKQKRWCPVHDRELAPDEIVKGWEVAKGQFVIVEEAELEALERHDDSRTIEIERSSRSPTSTRLDWTGRTSSFPARRRRSGGRTAAARGDGGGGRRRRRPVRPLRPESLCLVRARGEGLVLETLYLVEDVYSQAEIDEAMEATQVKKAELDLARQIVEGLQAPFDPEELTSEYRRDLRELLEAKLERRGDRRAASRSPRRRRRSTSSRRSRRAWRPRRPLGGRRRPPPSRRPPPRSDRRARPHGSDEGASGPS